MKKILSQFILTTWDDGHVTLEPYKKFLVNQQQNTLEDKTSGFSSRILQAISVIELTLDKLTKINQVDLGILNFVMVRSIDSVAEKSRVRPNTVRDKIGRQLGISLQEFSILLFNYYESKGINNKLKDLLLQKAGHNSLADDISFINSSFDKFAKHFWLNESEPN